MLRLIRPHRTVSLVKKQEPRSSTMNVGYRIGLCMIRTSYVRPEPVLSADNASEDDGVNRGKAGSHYCRLYRRAVIQLPSGTCMQCAWDMHAVHVRFVNYL